MRRPARWRNVALGTAGSGAIALASAFVLPRPVLDSWVGAVCFLVGPMALIFGGLFTSWWHAQAKAEAALRRGEGLVARWSVDAETWRRFVELNRTFSINQQPVHAHGPNDRVEVWVGNSALIVDGWVHTLAGVWGQGDPLASSSGDWTVEQAQMGGDAPCCIYLYVSMRGRGARVRTNLIFPVAADAAEAGRLAFESLRARAEHYSRLADNAA